MAEEDHRKSSLFARIKELKATNPGMGSAEALRKAKKERGETAEVTKEREEAADAERDAAKEREEAAHDEEDAAEAQEDAAGEQGSGSGAKPASPQRVVVQKSGGSKPSSGKSSSGGSHVSISGMGGYILLLIVSIVALGLKKFVGFDPITSFFITFVLGIFFMIVAYSSQDNKPKVLVVLAALVLDLGVSQGMLTHLPNFVSQYQGWLLGIHIFAWVFAAIIFFFMGLAENPDAGPWSWAIAIGIIGIGIAISFPLILETVDFQQSSYDDYVQLTSEQFGEVEEGAADIFDAWGDIWDCFGGTFTGTESNQDTCLKNKRIKRECEKSYGLGEENKFAVDACVQRKEEAVVVSGSSDSTITEITTARFEVPQGAAGSSSVRGRKYVFREGDVGKVEVLMNLIVENPLKQHLEVEVACKFTKSQDEIPGVVAGQNSFVLKDTTRIPKSIRCKPTQEIEGRYNVEFDAKFLGLHSESRLKRAFVGVKDSQWEEKWLPKIGEVQFSGEDRLSRAGEHFARINFEIGNALGEPIVRGDDTVILASTIENIGAGRMDKIRYYRVNAAEKGIVIASGEDPKCMGAVDIKIHEETASKDQQVYAPLCFIVLPEDLSNPKDYKIVTFTGEVEFDYVIEGRTSVDVKVLPKVEEEVVG